MSVWRGNIERKTNGPVPPVGRVSKERAIYNAEEKPRYFTHIAIAAPDLASVPGARWQPSDSFRFMHRRVIAGIKRRNGTSSKGLTSVHVGCNGRRRSFNREGMWAHRWECLLCAIVSRAAQLLPAADSGPFTALGAEAPLSSRDERRHAACRSLPPTGRWSRQPARRSVSARARGLAAAEAMNVRLT